jgi:hypothetical protein
MAKTPVALKIDGYAEREVTQVTYNFTRGTSADGQPSGIARGGKIVVKVKALNDGNCDLLEWINNTGGGKKGQIIFYDSRDQSKKMKSIDFENAYCVDFIESWEDKGDSARALAQTEVITISCQKIANGAASYENEWA